MALFIGGPANGKRIEVAEDLNTVAFVINPHPPAFTPDAAVLSATTYAEVRYKKESLFGKNNRYFVFVPEDWDGDRVVEELLLGYQTDKESRIDYIRTAKGTIFDNDDRIPDGRPYKV